MTGRRGEGASTYVTRAGRADDTDDFRFIDFERNIFEDLRDTERLTDAVHLNHGFILVRGFCHMGSLGCLSGLLIYSYATGVTASRKIERAIYDSIASRHIAANTHPGHNTLTRLRRRFGTQLEQLFVQV